jgi:hypothetical protein
MELISLPDLSIVVDNLEEGVFFFDKSLRLDGFCRYNT